MQIAETEVDMDKPGGIGLWESMGFGRVDDQTRQKPLSYTKR